jgi:alpha(1,3/1,4) fucosyltransferase
MLGDRIFDLASDGPVDQAPYTPWKLVREYGRAAGLEVMTADMVSARGIDPREVSVISYDWPPSTQTLFDAGAKLSVLTSLEPPVIAWELYYHLPRLSKSFPHVYLFRGGARRVTPSTQFHTMHFPQVRTSRPAHEDERRFLVSITSNKAMVRSFARWFDRPREVSIKRELAARLYPPIGRDLYLERLRAAAYFAKRSGFDLFGQGWQRRHPAVPRTLHDNAMRAYRGPVPEKLETLARYRFCLCFENSQFDGYVSEKIFDCFFAETIPIYLGAPDIERYVPRGTYIDMHQFRDYRDLEFFLDGITQSAAQGYLEAAAEFLQSDAFKPFSAECFAQQIVEMLRS